ncbi:MAG: DNA translocase FtsK, partial [Candidatus Paceibacteria bacterium]
IALGLVILLGLFGIAGPVGTLIDKNATLLFGVASVLIPLAFFFLGLIFISTKETNFYISTILGMGLTVLSLLGIIDEISPGSSGLVGAAIGILEKPFGIWASLVILITIVVSGILLTFESYFLSLFEQKPPKVKKDELLPTVAPPQEIIASPEKEELQESQKAVKEKEILAPPVTKIKPALKWQFPPLSLLHEEKPQPEVADISTNSKIIQRTLENFGIPVEMSGVHIGPTVTQYTLKPAQGVKLSKILALHNDLALALASHPIRIEAPIPGKALVGIEVPNKGKTLVRLRNLLQELSLYDGFHGLIFPLGRDVRGQAVFADLAKMPHLLIAGATGSGKSIFIHSLILTFLFRIPPHYLKFILIDPKRVELSQYEGIPYLLSPVITDGKKAIATLRWAISEMDSRYELLLSRKARDIFSYNASIVKAADKEPLPFIVIFIDELADLMAAYGREIEASIVRLSQMARATGIHLVVSTQRPSVEVITGLIKANITSRVAFQVASQVDSRTILDSAGAEKLIGSGDMLFISPDTPKPRRIQAPYVDESEVKAVANYILERAPQYQTILPKEDKIPEQGLAPLQEQFGEEYGFESAQDELYPEAYRVVVESQKASASLLQRRLRIGYARAARLLDMLEERGIIGPAKGAKPREVYRAKGSQPTT